MKITIIVPDDAVYVDGVMKAYAPLPLDLTQCGIPDNVHALQWNGVTGWIEFNDNPDGTKPANEPITSLPQWATNCVGVWETWTPYVPPTPPTLSDSAQPATTGTQTA